MLPAQLHHIAPARSTGLPTYADNAAALAGGLTAGDWYKTAAGQPLIVV
ncbi:MAG: hypothetical protein AAFW98_12560 [Pseudomonadota bacterium]